MADTVENTLPETSEWVDGIYQIETDDAVVGGPDGISNRQGKQLANRTLWLKGALATLSDKVVNATTSVLGLVQLATVTEAKTGADTAKAVTPAGLKAAITDSAYSPSSASESTAGILKLATVASAKTGTDTATAVTPAGLKAAITDSAYSPSPASESTAGILKLATVASAKTGTDTATAVTPAGLKAAFDDKPASFQSIGTSVASNALTLTYAGGNLAFRDAVLGNGAFTTVPVPALSLTVPGGVTLGTFNGQKATLALLALYNAGAPVLAVTNMTGGQDLSEAGLINATAISAAPGNASITASQSGNTLTVSAVASGNLSVGQRIMSGTTTYLGKITAFGTGSGGTGTYTLSASQTVSSAAMTALAPSPGVYSSAAVSNSPYRVVGTVTLTQSVAGVWTAQPTLVQGIGGLAGAAMSSIGYGQAYQDVTSSRALNTVYWNLTGKPIYVHLSTVMSTSALAAYIFIYDSAGAQLALLQGTASTGAQITSFDAIVPSGCGYMFSNSNGGTVTLNSVIEMR